MKKLKKSKILILILLIVFIIIEIRAFTNSRANKLLDIAVKITDASGFISDEKITLQASSNSDNEYYIILPEMVNEKIVEKYLIEEKQINTEKIEDTKEKNDVKEESKNNKTNETIITNNENTTTNVAANEISNEANNNETKIDNKNTINSTNETTKDEANKEDVKEENIDNNETDKMDETSNEKNEDTKDNDNKVSEKSDEKIEKTDNSEEIKDKKENETKESVIYKEIEKSSGEKLFLTKDEIKNQEIEIKAKYNTKEKGNTKLYLKHIEKEVDKKIVKIEGYMPQDSSLKVEVVNKKDIDELIKEYGSSEASLKVVYDIKIVSQDKEYEPTDFDEDVKVSIHGLEDIDLENQEYKIVHINKDNTTEKIDEVQTKGNTVTFNTNSFSEYAIILDSTNSTKGIVNPKLLYASDSNSEVEPWDGNDVSTSYIAGNGTLSNPYLISTGAQLSYFKNQVNSGNTYNGTYFQLISDIDLGDHDWEPIGKSNAPFSGIFDGAGHTISNANIITDSSWDLEIYTYGFFGSIGNGNNRAIIKNLELDNFKINITATSAPEAEYDWWSGEYTAYTIVNAGIVAGRMYNNSSIINCIAKNSNISTTSGFRINNEFHFFVGGIAGFATNTETSEADPGANRRYVIENSLSDVDIDTSNVTLRTRNNGQMNISYANNYAVGGVIGGIRSQPVWPTNCLYVGSINSTYAFVGPIFAYLRNNTEAQYSNYGSNDNYNTIWNGNDAGNLTCTSYFYNYRVSGTSFTRSITSGNVAANTNYRRSSSRSNSSMNYYQGVNKGIYQNDMTTMLSGFNDYVDSNSGYLSWGYENDEFYLISRFDVNLNKTNAPTYIVNVTNNYDTGTVNYNYKWYVNEVLDDQTTGNTKIVRTDWENEYKVLVLVSDGTYNGGLEFTVPKLELHVTFDYLQTNPNALVANIEGTGLMDENYNAQDYTYKWYKVGIDGEEEELQDNDLIINGFETEFDYKIVATNNQYDYMSVEGTYVSNDRIVVFVDYTNGSNYNDGFAPTRAVQDFSTAYSKFQRNTSRNKNVIVLMGYYPHDDDFLTSTSSSTYDKAVTITGKYNNVDYEGVLSFIGSPGDTTYPPKMLNADTTFMQLSFDGRIRTSTRQYNYSTRQWEYVYSYTTSTSDSFLYFFLQGYSLTVGEGVKMIGYTTANTYQGLITNDAPGFHIFAAWLMYDYSSLPRNNPHLVIKSGQYGRFVLRRKLRTFKSNIYVLYYIS